MNDHVPTHFEQMGGAVGVRGLVDRFYDIMDAAPEAAGIRSLHPESLKTSREKLYLFLTGWTGGPPVYVERHGHPMLRAKHLPFPIGKQRFRAVADHMRNRDG
jgi:hemoglobin